MRQLMVGHLRRPQMTSAWQAPFTSILASVKAFWHYINLEPAVLLLVLFARIQYTNDSPYHGSNCSRPQ